MSNTTSTPSPGQIKWLSGLSNLLDNFSCTVFLPALPFITTLFVLSRAYGQLLFTLFLLGTTLSQFVSGYLADQWGRRKIILTLLILYIIGCFLPLIGTHTALLFIGFGLQGFGIGGTYSNSQALIAESSSDSANTMKVMALVTFLVGWSSAIGTLLGGVLVHHFSWKAPLAFLGLLGILIWLCFLFLPKEAKTIKSLSIKAMFRDYFQLYSRLSYLRVVFCSALLYSAYFVFLTITPFLYVHDLHVSAAVYGLYMIIPMVATMLGQLACTFLGNIWRHDTLIHMGLVLSLVGGVIAAGVAYSPWMSPLSIVLSASIWFFASGLTIPGTNAKAMHLGIGLVGTAASLLSVTINLFSSGHSFVAAHFDDEFMSVYILLILILNVVLYVGLGQYVKQRSQ